jgi:high affinity sulfate transporter 1
MSEDRGQLRSGGLASRVPGVAMIRDYDLRWLRNDLSAGLVLTTLLVPAGMAYAEASGLPPVNGLYASVAALVVYAVVGPSRILVLGPDSSLAPLIAATVVPLAAGDPARAVALASLLAIFAGVVCVVAGLIRFGFITDLLSMPLRHGYMNGIAVTIILSQLPKLLGFSASGETALDALRGLWSGLVEGLTNTTALVVGGSCLAAILILRRYAPRVPGLLIVVVGAILATRLLDLDDLAVVGVLPSGVPHLVVPRVDGSDVGTLVGAALGIALISFADTSVLSRSFAARGGYRVDTNQELIGLGVTNVAAGFVQGFPISSSSSRTPVAEAAGAKTQLTGVTGAVAILVVLIWLPWLFRDLPSTTLAAIVIASAMSLFDLRVWVRLAKVRPSELAVSLVAFFGVTVIGVLAGLGIAVVVALLNFVRRAWAPHVAELVRVDNVKGYHDAARHPEGRRIPGLVIFRFDAPLFFANAESFEEELQRLIIDRGDVRRVVFSAAPITDVDATGAEVLADVHRRLQAEGIVLAFAELKGHVRDRLARFGLVDAIGPDHFYRTMGEAVHAYVEQEHVDWIDWEDRT